MKSTIKNLSILFSIILISSCTKSVEIMILKVNHKYVEIRNGDKRLFAGFTGGSNITDQNAIILAPINYKDSIFVEVSENRQVVFKGAFKLSRGTYLYIDNLNGDYAVYSQNKKKPLY